MKLLLPVVVFCFLALSQVFGEEFGPKDDLDYWTNGNQIQDEWLQADPFRELLRRMTRKPRPHQFIGLMGKRSSGKITSASICTSLSPPLSLSLSFSLSSQSYLNRIMK
uniref:Tachykinin precursor 1 n=1 Tax=Astyanax mexicanus TaxID=7994 RepID=A0A3B1JWL1_ASTMX